ncbi:MAG: hypothetical protein FJ149_05435 [Euryarchaeota archaeon]|nr:hypothetical protein [Euryarchaeota archaeon]
MDKGLLCASLTALLLLLALMPGAGRAAEANSDAFFVLDEFSDQPVKLEGSASYDYLEVKAVLHVNVTGFYNLTARLEYARAEFARLSNTSYLNPGTHAILLRFRNGDIHAGQAAGNYIMRLSLVTPNFPLDPIEGSYETRYYHFSDFNPSYIAPYPPGSVISFTDGPVLHAWNSFMNLTFDKDTASLSYHYTQNRDGRNGRFTVTFLRVLGYLDSGDSFFQRSEVTHEAALANGTWRPEPVETGIHPAYGPFLRFNITYYLDLVDLRLGSTASELEVTFSFHMTGNPHTSADRALVVAGSSQVELQLSMRLSHIIGGSGLVLEQLVGDSAGNHEILLRDQINEFRIRQDDFRDTEQRLNPLDDESIPKLAFINRWEPVLYGRYTWVTAARAMFQNVSVPATTDVSYIPEGAALRLFLAYHIRDPKASFLTINDTFVFGLEGDKPPPPRPVRPGPAPHDPLLYILGAMLALAIIFASMRYRTRSYIEEERELERIEERELSEEEGEPPSSIEERAFGEEEEARRRWERREKAPEEPPGEDGERPGDQEGAGDPAGGGR